MRDSIDLCGVWRFQPDPYFDGERMRFFSPDYNAGRWRASPVPSQIDDTDPEILPGEGIAWYRRVVLVPRQWQGTDVSIRFEGVNYHARVWINGREVGAHDDGFLRFELPVTDALRFGEENLIVVRVDNLRYPYDVPGMERAWRNRGGILREVSLISRPPAHIADARILAEPAGADGTLRISLTLVNRGTTEAAGRPAAAITDSAGRPVGQIAGDQVRVPAGASVTVQLEGTVSGVSAWSPDSPVLYRAALSFAAGDRPVDSMEVRFGFRSIRVDGERLLLNGQDIYLTGFNRHEDSPRTGMCTDLELVRRDLVHMKSAGANWVRLCHYPHHPGELDLCDELGLLVMAEIPLWQWKGNAEGAENAQRKLATARRQLASMIARDFNHPSIIVWSVSNETFEQHPEVADGNRQLIRLARELDRSRPITHVSDHWGTWTTGDFTEDDILCINWYPSLRRLIPTDPWGFNGRSAVRVDQFDYSLGANDWQRELAIFHKRLPGRPILIAEFGYPSIEGVYDCTVGEDVQANVIRAEFAMFNEPWIVGATIWCYADHPWAREGGMKDWAISPFGVVSHKRRELEAFRAAAELFKARQAQRRGQA